MRPPRARPGERPALPSGDRHPKSGSGRPGPTAVTLHPRTRTPVAFESFFRPSHQYPGTSTTYEGGRPHTLRARRLVPLRGWKPGRAARSGRDGHDNACTHAHTPLPALQALPTCPHVCPRPCQFTCVVAGPGASCRGCCYQHPWSRCRCQRQHHSRRRRCCRRCCRRCQAPRYPR